MRIDNARLRKVGKEFADLPTKIYRDLPADQLYHARGLVQLESAIEWEEFQITDDLLLIISDDLLTIMMLDVYRWKVYKYPHAMSKHRHVEPKPIGTLLTM